MGDEGFEALVEGGEIRMSCYGVEGGVIAVIALILPDVDLQDALLVNGLVGITWSKHTKCVTVAYFCPPAPD